MDEILPAIPGSDVDKAVTAFSSWNQLAVRPSHSLTAFFSRRLWIVVTPGCGMPAKETRRWFIDLSIT
jgi:hypothetical protein